MPINLPLPSELKLARKKAGLTQVHLSQLSGVAQSVIAKIESGSVDPAYSTVVRLFSAIDSAGKKVKLVKDVMHRGVETLKSTDVVGTASRKMKRLGVSQLPVVQRNRVVALISEEDILTAIEKGVSPATSVMEIASSAPPFISSSAPAPALPAILRYSPIVCVVEGYELVGVVTRADLLSVF